MITNQDRSKWFGASDAHIIMGNWKTQTFRKWWCIKLGIYKDEWGNIYTRAGNLMEHPIINTISEITNRKIKKGRYPKYKIKMRLRANYDGLCERLIEIKTSKNIFQKVPKAYWEQCQVLMYATGRRECELWAYQMTENDYRCPYFPDIEPERLKMFLIKYDRAWIEFQFLPRISRLSYCLRKGLTP